LGNRGEHDYKNSTRESEGKKKQSLLPQFHSSSNDLIYIFGDENLRMTNTVIIPKHKHKLYAAATTAEPQHLKLDIE
jgi:hypothetical protein